MTRKEVKLAWIANDSTRRTTLRKRRNGLLKKASELSILCNVKVCAVIYDPEKPEPEVWPSASEAMNILHEFKAMPEYGRRGTRRVDQEGFLRQRNAKLRQLLLRQQVQNKQLEVKILMARGLAAGTRRLNDVSYEDAAILRHVIGDAEKDVHRRIEGVKVQKAWAERPMHGGANYEASNPNDSAPGVLGNTSGGGLEDTVMPSSNGSDLWMYPTFWTQHYIVNNWPIDPSVFPFGHL